jgi:hypothetical protein
VGVKPRLFHPSRKALQAWLNGDPDVDAKLDAHVATCGRCANTIEHLDAEDHGNIGEALALVLQPPSGLSERLEEKVAARLDSKVMLGVLGDLFAAGIETSRMLIMEETGEEDE